MTLLSGSSAGNFLLSRIPSGANAKAFFQGYALSPTDQSALVLAAREDSFRYLYNGVASFLGGVSGLRDQHAAWAITKMYYCAFYVARSALCRSGHVIFHAPRDGAAGYTQYEIKVAVGALATIPGRIPSTHKLVAKRFSEQGYPAFMQSLAIDGSDPYSWLMEQREYWQYRSGRFSDPDLPPILEQIEIDKVQRHLAAYAEDTSGIYLSDPAHAVLALPFRLVTWSLSVEPLRNVSLFSPDDISHLRKRCLVGKQLVTAISRHFEK